MGRTRFVLFSRSLCGADAAAKVVGANSPRSHQSRASTLRAHFVPRLLARLVGLLTGDMGYCGRRRGQGPLPPEPRIRFPLSKVEPTSHFRDQDVDSSQAATTAFSAYRRYLVLTASALQAVLKTRDKRSSSYTPIPSFHRDTSTRCARQRAYCSRRTPLFLDRVRC